MMRIWLLLLWLVPLAQAQEGWNPLWGVYLPPLRVSAPAGCTLELEGTISNHLSYSAGTWGEIETDVEEIRLVAGLYRSSEWGQFGLHLPFRLYYGGFLDYLLNPYHAWLGLPTSPAGMPRSLIAVSDPSGGIRQVNRPQFGLGDPVLSWSLGVEGLWGSASLALPLGDPGRFMGAGGWRAAVVLGLQEPHWGTALQLVVPLGPQPIFSGLGARPTLGAWLWSRLPWGLPGRLELQGSTSPIVVGGRFAATLIILRYTLGGFSIAEDLTPALPDVVLGYRGWWECPW
jgi:hypothetical protein